MNCSKYLIISSNDGIYFIIFSFFILEGIMMCLSNFQYYFEISRPVEISTRPILAKPTNENFENQRKLKKSWFLSVLEKFS